MLFEKRASASTDAAAVDTIAASIRKIAAAADGSDGGYDEATRKIGRQRASLARIVDRMEAADGSSSAARQARRLLDDVDLMISDDPKDADRSGELWSKPDKIGSGGSDGGDGEGDGGGEVEVSSYERADGTRVRGHTRGKSTEDWETKSAMDISQLKAKAAELKARYDEEVAVFEETLDFDYNGFDYMSVEDRDYDLNAARDVEEKLATIVPEAEALKRQVEALRADLEAAEEALDGISDYELRKMPKIIRDIERAGIEGDGKSLKVRGGRKAKGARSRKSAGWNDLVLRLQQALEDAPYQMAEDPSEELLREMSRVVEMVGEASPDSVGDIRRAVEELQRLAPDAEWDEVERMLGDLEREGPDSFRGRKSRAGRLARRAEAKARRGTKSGGSVEDLLNELIDALVLAPIDPGASEPEDRDEADRIYNDLVDEIDEVEAAIRSMLDGGTPADTASVERLRSMVQKIERSNLGDFAWWTDVYAAIDAVAREVSGKSAAPLAAKSRGAHAVYG